MEPFERIIVPLDTSDAEQALEWVHSVGRVGAFKIGYEFICSFFAGMLTLPHEHMLKRLRRTQEIFSAPGARFMLDLKLNDIRNTMEGALRAIRALNPAFITVHASAGPMALERLAKQKGDAKLIAVTVLTSLESWECEEIFGAKPPKKVRQFAIMAYDAGVDGVVCSPLELPVFEADPWRFQNFLKLTPGVRPPWHGANDQKRVATPAEAIQAGADYLVIGRPITNPPPEIGSSRDAVAKIVKEIASVT